ncbi:MAG TPA: hypothetical protein VHE12_05965 [bacterium]|nr:hypothetical protein [bacterium]
MSIDPFEISSYPKPCRNCGHVGFLEYCDVACRDEYKRTNPTNAEQDALIRDIALTGADAECYP